MLKCLAFLAALVLVAPASAQEARPAERHVIVSATGEAERVPDTALMSFGVVTEGETAADAFQSNSQAASNLVEGLKELGIQPRHITTRNISIQPQYDHSGSERGAPPRIVGYVAENQVEVRFVNLDDLGQKLDRAVSLGANSISGPEFVISKPEEAETEARKKALENALAKARTYAEAGGFALGDILQIEESPSFDPGPRPMMMRAEAASMDKAVAPVEAGTRRVTVDVVVKVAIE